MVKNIIFDLGNVLLDFSPVSYLKDLGFNESQVSKLNSLVFKSKEWLMLDRGTISEKEAVEIWQQRSPDLKEEISLVMNGWKKILNLKTETLEILKSLFEKNYKLYVLSNFHQQAFEYVRQKYNFFKYFDALVISAEVNLIKPEPEIYDYILNKFNLNPAETIFIDDSKENIEAALKKGIRVIHFTDAESLKKELNFYFKE